MRMILAAAAVLLVQAASVEAAPQVSIWGVGEQTCHEAYSDERSQSEVRPWIAGYLSATAALTRGTEHPQAVAGLEGEVEALCKARPAITVQATLRSVLKPLRKR